MAILSRILIWLAAVFGAASLLLACLAVARSLLPYNEVGAYFDGLVTYHEQSVLVYAVLAMVALLVAGALAWVALRARRH